MDVPASEMRLRERCLGGRVKKLERSMRFLIMADAHQTDAPSDAPST